jgi:hypothetical protein
MVGAAKAYAVVVESAAISDTHAKPAAAAPSAKHAQAPLNLNAKTTDTSSALAKISAAPKVRRASATA